MKENTHPDYHACEVTCSSCNTSFTVGSTLSKINVNICSQCHPFYTGKQKFIDTEGRIDKFKAKYAKFAAPKA
ncbi:UNVERIFIED_CONTAM: hypothetical protein GTU68_065946 [Idotea baltica]|nr:hypothetical protein [Idotea baltica]